MQKRYLPFFFLVLTFFIRSAYAEEDINIENLPAQLADAWGITEFAAGIFISMILLFTFLIPTLLIAKGKEGGTLAIMIVGFGIMGFCISIGYLNYWFLLLITLLVAALYAKRVTETLG